MYIIESLVKELTIAAEYAAIENCPKLERINIQSVNKLNLRNLGSIRILPKLEDIYYVRIEQLNNLETVHWGSNVHHIELHNLPSLTGEFEVQPCCIFYGANLPKVRGVKFSECSHLHLENVPMATLMLPRNLEILTLKEIGIKEIELVSTMTSLVLENCPIKEIGQLPDGLQYLRILQTDIDVKKLILPKSLKFLDLGMGKNEYPKMNLPEGCRVCVGKGKNRKVHTYTCGRLI